MIIARASTADEAAAPLGVGFIGIGKLGTAVLELLPRQPVWLRPVGAAVRDVRRARQGLPPTMRLTEHPYTVVSDPRAQVVAELSGDLEQARVLIVHALRLGKPVVIADPQLLTLYGDYLQGVAHESGAAFLTSAAEPGATTSIQDAAELVMDDLIQATRRLAQRAAAPVLETALLSHANQAPVLSHRDAGSAA